MAVYLVTWDLDREEDYPEARAAFVAHLGRIENIADPALDSVRFISTPWRVDEVADYLQQKLEERDALIVTRLVKGAHQGKLAQRVWEWIEARIEH